MLVLAGILLALLSAGAVALLLLGFAAFVERRWRNGAIKLAAGAAAWVLVFLCLSGTAFLLMRTDTWTEGVDPQVKARVLADNISGLMNVTALGLPFGLVAGAILLWRRRAKARAG